MAIQLCTQCLTQAKPKTHTRGSFFLELLLWLCFLVPGLIYSLWRLTTRRQVCRNCLSPSIIPIDSPRATLMKKAGT